MLASAEAVMRKGWYRIKGVQDGDRDLAEQLIGLEPLIPFLPGAQVLDLGTAECLIGRWCVEQGAAIVHGIEIVPAIAAEARRQTAGLPIEILDGDLGNWKAITKRHAATLLPSYRVVLALSVLHKVAAPDRLLRAAAARARHHLVIRLPAPVLVDERSGRRPYDVAALLRHEFDLVAEPPGPRGEWCAFFQRRAAPVPMAT